MWRLGKEVDKATSGRKRVEKSGGEEGGEQKWGKEINGEEFGIEEGRSEGGVKGEDYEFLVGSECAKWLGGGCGEGKRI